MSDKKIAVIGLDTSHTVAFTKLIQSTEPDEKIIDGMRIVNALRFPSAFQTEEGQDERQGMLEKLGVTMKSSLEEAVEGMDAIFLEINDPAIHLQYFEEAAKFGLPIFIDKPLAANIEEGRRIQEIAEQAGIPAWSASSLRFVPSLVEAKKTVIDPVVGHTFGALGEAAAGSDLVWYGVHAVEMLIAGLGTGTESVKAIEDASGITLMINYKDGRRGIVECLRGLYRYGGRIQSKESSEFFDSSNGSVYIALMSALHDFVCDGVVPVPLSEAHEILAILNTGERSLASGKTETIIL